MHFELFYWLWLLFPLIVAQRIRFLLFTVVWVHVTSCGLYLDYFIKSFDATTESVEAILYPYIDFFSV